jgi:hypothetical protein
MNTSAIYPYVVRLSDGREFACWGEDIPHAVCRFEEENPTSRVVLCREACEPSARKTRGKSLLMRWLEWSERRRVVKP